MGKKQYESPQVAPDGLATPKYGGKSPSGKDVGKSANARSEKRHAPKTPQNEEAYRMIPDSGGQSLDKAGVNNDNYIVKKGLEFGVSAMYNSLPPGMDLEDQENADIREQMLRNYSGGLSYPGDGWD